RLLLSALDQLAWANTGAASVLVEECRAELEELTHVHAALDLSRLDFLLDLAAAWRRLTPGQYPALARLIPQSWCRPFSEIHMPLLTVVEELIANPIGSLATLDSLKASAPAVLGQFGHMVEQFRYLSGFSGQQNRPGLHLLLLEFMEETCCGSYAQFRP